MEGKQAVFAAVELHKVEGIANKLLKILHEEFPKNVLHAIVTLKAAEEHLMAQAEKIYGGKITLAANTNANQEELEAMVAEGKIHITADPNPEYAEAVKNKRDQVH